MTVHAQMHFSSFYCNGFLFTHLSTHLQAEFVTYGCIFGQFSLQYLFHVKLRCTYDSKSFSLMVQNAVNCLNLHFPLSSIQNYVFAISTTRENKATEFVTYSMKYWICPKLVVKLKHKRKFTSTTR